LTPPLLVLGWGNPSRGDDALGPLFVERLRAATGNASVEWLTDYQLQIEHALDLAGRERVLFVDASLTCQSPFEVTPLQPARDASVTSHALSPAAVMQVYRDIHGREPPSCTLLAIRGHDFELGAPLAEAAQERLEQALRWGRGWLAGRGASGQAGAAG
jgi:hydrogenase maturation protease